MPNFEQSLLKLNSFEDFFTEEVRTIANYASLQHFREGQVLIKTGAPGNFLGILLQGEAQIVINGEAIATRQAGDVLGEMAIIRSEPRIADVVAVTDGDLVVITIEDIAALQQFAPHIATKFLNTLAQSTIRKLRETKMRDTTEYVALVAELHQLPQLLDFLNKHQHFLTNQAVATIPEIATAIRAEISLDIQKVFCLKPFVGEENSLGSLILSGNILALVYLRDPWRADETQTELSIVSRFCDNYQIPWATNLSTADILFDFFGS